MKYIIIVALLMTLLITPSFAAAWWDYDYSRRNNITITNAAGSMTNYTIPINVTYDSDMQSDFDDIRFVTNCSDDAEELPVFKEIVNDGSDALYWVNIPTINTTICMYYGNGFASSVSDDTSNFKLFEDFEDYSYLSFLDGQGGWTLTSGNDVWQVLRGDAIHGINYVRVTDRVAGGDDIIAKSVPNTANIRMVFYLAMNASAARPELGFVDTSAQMSAIHSNEADDIFEYLNKPGSPTFTDLLYTNLDTWYRADYATTGGTFNLRFGYANGSVLNTTGSKNFESGTTIKTVKLVSANTGVNGAAYDLIFFNSYNSTVQYSFLGEEEIPNNISITIESPENITYHAVTSVWLNWTFIGSIENVWYSLNMGDNVSVDPYTFVIVNDIPIGLNNITLYANDSYGNLTSNTVWFTIDIVPEYSESASYSDNAIETSTEGITLEISLDDTSDISDAVATLIYDDVPQSSVSGTVTASGITFNSQALLPYITDDIENRTFYWKFSFDYLTGRETNTSLNYTQTLYKMIISDCENASLTDAQTLIMYLRDEDTDALVTGSLDISFDIWRTSGYARSYSFNGTDNTTFDFCIYPEWASYTADSMAEYYADNYSTRTYYLDEATLDNETDEIDLYLESNTTTEQVTMTVYNQYGFVEEGVYITIQRYFIGTGTYSTVAVVKTNSNGQAVSELTLDTVWYRFTLSKDGEVLEQFEPTLVTTTELTFYITGEGLGEWTKYIDSIFSNCTYNSVTNTSICTVTDTSGLMQTARLTVSRYTSLGWIIVCTDTDTSSTVTLVCSLGSTSGNLYFYRLEAIFSETAYTLESGFLDFRSQDSGFGTLGVFMALVIIIVLTMIGAVRGPVAAMVMSGVGVAITWGTGLLAIEYSAVVAFFIVIGVAAYKMRGGSSGA